MSQQLLRLLYDYTAEKHSWKQYSPYCMIDNFPLKLTNVNVKEFSTVFQFSDLFQILITMILIVAVFNLWMHFVFNVFNFSFSNCIVKGATKTLS